MKPALLKRVMVKPMSANTNFQACSSQIQTPKFVFLTYIINVLTALKEKGLYFEDELQLIEKSLFIKKFKIPDNISAGDIKVSLYEIQNNEVINFSQKKLNIQKKGLTSKLEKMLKDQSLIYTIILVVFSIIFSLLSNWLFRRR